MIIDTIELTDNKEEMARIGKALIAEKPAIYKENVLAALRKSVAHYMPNASEEEREQRLYRAVYDYWTYGNTVDEDFYLGFGRLTHKQKLEYATMRVRMAFYARLNDLSLAHLFDNKEETYELFKDYYLRDLIVVSGEEDFDKFKEFVKKHPVFVAKPNNMSTSLGVCKIEMPEGAEVKAFFVDLLKRIKNYDGNSPWRKNATTFILEELIDQHPALAALHPASVNCIRITTVRVGKDVHIYQPWIKVGAGGSFVACAVRGGQVIGINSETGVLDSFGYGEVGEICECHPTTGVQFMGYQLPRWSELATMSKELAGKLPESINYVGWDFVLTPKGWCILEGNYRGDFMWQLFRQKGMRRNFENLIGWKYNKQFWWQ